ncbi:hypothetical protein K9N50_07750 [bacterium]|nr:hypothetical protein [bacterium]
MKKLKTYILPLFIASILGIYLFTGCSQKEETQWGDLLVSLVDTVFAGQNREVFLSDLSGGFYYDDAFRDGKRSDYGFSRFGNRLIAGWQITSPDGKPLDEPDFCYIRPRQIERHFLSGITETVECPPKQTGLLLTIEPDNVKQFNVKLFFDFRPLDSLESPEYNPVNIDESGAIVISRKDGFNGFIAVAGLSRKGVELTGIKHEIEHPYSDNIGRIGITSGYEALSYQHHSKKSLYISFGWGETKEKAIKNALSIYKNRTNGQNERIIWMKNILNQQAFYCENKSFEKAFNWARLNIAGLMLDRYNKQFLITGFPNSPYPDGWFTMTSLNGITASELSPETALNMIDVMIDYQNKDSLSDRYGMFPTKIKENKAEYRIPEIAGLAAIAYGSLTDLNDVKDTVREDRFALALVRDLVGTLKYRMCQGLVVNDSNEHFLWDGPAAPNRSGATIESQVLFHRSRSFLKDYRRLSLIADLPSALVNQKGYDTFYMAGYGNLAIEPGSVPGVSGTFDIPLPWYKVSSMFFDDISGWCADRLLYLNDNYKRIYEIKNEYGLKLPLKAPWTLRSMYNISRDSTQRVSLPIVTELSIHSSGRLKGFYNSFIENNLIAETGFRTLGSNEVDFQDAHLYQLEEAPYGTMSKGDVLLWTSDLLARYYIKGNNLDSLLSLTEYLIDRVNNSGVAGGLPEAESGSLVTGEYHAVGNSIFAASLASFIRIASEYVIHIEPARGNYLRIRPKLPKEWGNYKIECAYLDGRLTFERKSETVFRVSQEGITPILRLVLDMSTPLGRTAQLTVRLNPGDKQEIHFLTEDGEIWKSEVKDYE